MSRWLVVFLVALSFGITGCAELADVMGWNGQSDKEDEELLVQTVSFNDVMNKVFRPKCIGCHGTSGGVSLETLTDARAHLREIWQSTIVERRMPKSPYPPLDDSERRLLRAWIRAGGPDRPANGGPSTPPEPLEPRFASIRRHILEPKCLSCHGPGGEAARIPLASVEDLIDSPLEIVIPGNPDESGLILVVTEGARKFMPPPESGMAPLKPEEIDVLRTWITNGAKD